MKLAIRQALQSVYRKLSTYPVVGNIARIFLSVIRLPETKNSLQQNIADLDKSVATLAKRISAMDERISSLNEKVLVMDKDSNNLVMSVPVALRHLERDLANIRNQINSLASQLKSGRD